MFVVREMAVAKKRREMAVAKNAKIPSLFGEKFCVGPPMPVGGQSWRAMNGSKLEVVTWLRCSGY